MLYSARSSVFYQQMFILASCFGYKVEFHQLFATVPFASPPKHCMKFPPLWGPEENLDARQGVHPGNANQLPEFILLLNH